MVPSSDTISGFTAFAPQTTIRSAEVNANFDIWRGHILPFTTNTVTGSSLTYDLGSATYRWREVFGKLRPHTVSTTGSMSLTSSNDVVLMNSTSATITASLPTAASLTGTCFLIKNIGTANSVLADAAGTETIDGTITINILPKDWLEIVSDGSNWHMI